MNTQGTNYDNAPASKTGVNCGKCRFYQRAQKKCTAAAGYFANPEPDQEIFGCPEFKPGTFKDPNPS